MLEISIIRCVRGFPFLDCPANPSSKLTRIRLAEWLVEVVVCVFTLRSGIKVGFRHLLHECRRRDRPDRGIGPAKKIGRRRLDRLPFELAERGREASVREGSGEQTSSLAKFVVCPDDFTARFIEEKMK